MRTKKISCNSDDYDFYTIPIPVKNLFNRQKNRYISSQLEKLHPCFSDDCSYDSHLKLRKNHLIADVVVMQKYKVAEYKAQNKRLYVKEQKTTQIFASKKQTLVVGVSVLAVVVLIALLIAAVIHGVVKKELTVTQTQTPPQTVPDTNLQETVPLNTPKLISFIATHEGKITNFVWSCDGYTENASMKISGIYPEQLEASLKSLRLSPMIFENSLPALTVSLSQKSIQTQSTVPQQTQNFKARFREILFQNNFTLAEESVAPYGVKLSAPLENTTTAELAQNFTAIFTTLLQNNFSLSKIQLDCNEQCLKLELIFSEVKLLPQTELYESLINNMEAFLPEQSAPPLRQPRVVTQQIATTKQPAVQKVGQIIKPDGSVQIYYKDENGKIIKR